MKRKSALVILVIVILSCWHSSTAVTNPEVTTENKQLENVHGLVLMTDMAMHGEYAYPVEFLTEYGCNIAVVAPKSSVTTSNGVVVEADFLISEMNNVSEYDFLFVPGGTSAGSLLDIPESIALVVEAYESGLVMIAICAGPIVFVEANIVSGYNLSGNVAVAVDIENAGGNFIPDIICVDRQFVTSDFPFMYTLAQQGILKALGYYETNPPEIVDYTIESLAIGKAGGITLVLEMSDEYTTEKVSAEILTNNDDQSQTVYEQVQLDKNDTTFTMTLAEVPFGNYSIRITAEDVLGNSGSYELEESIVIQSTRKLAINPYHFAVLFINWHSSIYY